MDRSAGFDDTAKEEIRSRADISAVIGRYVNLKSSGQTLKGLCPFHKEKTPSFHVNPSRGYFHCFGCGKGGDVFTFLQEVEGIGFYDTLKLLADETGVQLQPSTSTGAQDHGALSKSDLLQIHRIAVDYYYAQIRRNQVAIDYFKSRGLKPETVRDFQLGYAPGGWTGLLSYCRSKNIAHSSLVACGLAIEKKTGSMYDRFRERIMFPLCDFWGNPIAFAGRGLQPDAKPKYLNSPETSLYRKNAYLYGFHKARKSIKESGKIIIVEGYMDFLSLYQEGIHNVIATSGTALTQEHARVIQRFIPRVILVFDGDTAGQTAAQRAVFTLAPFDLDVSILVLPDNEDPDSYVKKYGGDAFTKLVNDAQNATDYIIQKTIETHGNRTPREKTAVIDHLKPIAESITNPIFREEFKKILAERLHINSKLVYYRKSDGTRESSTPKKILHNDEHYLATLEGSFLRILLTRPDFIDQAANYIAPETLTDGASADMYSLLLSTYTTRGNLDGIIDQASDPDQRRILSMMLVKPIREEHIHEELVQKILHLRAKFLRYTISDIKNRMKHEPQQRIRLLEQLKDCTIQLRELEEGA